jgi:hypothetical protein
MSLAWTVDFQWADQDEQMLTEKVGRLNIPHG